MTLGFRPRLNELERSYVEKHTSLTQETLKKVTNYEKDGLRLDEDIFMLGILQLDESGLLLFDDCKRLFFMIEKYLEEPTAKIDTAFCDKRL